jgi:hypothetical protein
MKTIIKIPLLITIVLLGILTLMSSCNKVTNPLDGTKLVVNYDLINTKLNFKFYDAATGLLIGSGTELKVKAHIEGEDKDAVIDITGAALDDYGAESNNGFITLALNPNGNYKPSKENPVTFTLVATLNGYLTTSKIVSVTDEGNYEYRIDMVNLSNPPQGVSVKFQNNATTVNSGVVGQTVTVTTDDGNASVTLKEGTVLKDKDGNPLSGNVNVMITFFDNHTDESLQAFPGGLTPMVNQNGNTERGVFYSAGFVALEITDNSGKKAAIVEQNTIPLNMNVSDNTYNPETQMNAAAGDEVPVYSYDPETGEWNYEQSATIGAGSRGLSVSTELTHLSFWNFDWFTPFTCDEGVTLHVNLNDNVCNCMFVQGIMRKAVDNTFLRWVGFFACDGDDVTFTYLPGGMPVYIDWVNPSCQSFFPEVFPPELDIPDLCEPVTYNINVSGHDNLSTVIVDFSAYCASSPDVIIKPSFGAWYRPVNSWCWQYAVMINGHSEICGVEVGQEYVVAVYFNGEWYQETVLVDQSQYIYLDIQIPADICDEVFGL